MHWSIERWIELLLGFLVIALVTVLIIVTIDEQQEWETFKAKHNCKVVGKKKGHVSTSIGVGINAGGTGTIVMPITSSTPDQTAYKCDDGITYWR